MCTYQTPDSGFKYVCKSRLFIPKNIIFFFARFTSKFKTDTIQKKDIMSHLIKIIKITSSDKIKTEYAFVELTARDT